MIFKKHRTLLKTVVYIFSALLLFIALVLLVIFIVIFWGPVSHNLTDWYEWGSFLTFLVSIVNLVCFLLLTYKAYLFQEDSYNKQMKAQKIELETSFRKSHIEDVRVKITQLDDLPNFILDDDSSYNEFESRCYALIRIFSIYAEVNAGLFEECYYVQLNEYFSELKKILEDIENNRTTAREQSDKLEKKIGQINTEMIKLEKKLSEYTLECINKAF